MRKIINNKRYDTDTAEHVGYWDNGMDGHDFRHESATLYRKRSGEYFLHGEGGPMSRYAEARGTSSWVGGERIMPLSWDDARRWAEERLDAGEYEAEFGEVDEGDGDAVVMTLRAPAWVKAAMDRECARTGETRGQVLARIAEALK